MKKTFSFLFLNLLIFSSISSCLSSDLTDIKTELNTNISKPIKIVSKEEFVDVLVKDFYSIYDKESENYPVLSNLKKTINIKSFIEASLSLFVEKYGTQSGSLPNNYRLLCNLIKASDQVIRNSKEYHLELYASDEEEEGENYVKEFPLFGLLERLAPVWYVMNAKAK